MGAHRWADPGFRVDWLVECSVPPSFQLHLLSLSSPTGFSLRLRIFKTQWDSYRESHPQGDSDGWLWLLTLNRRNQFSRRELFLPGPCTFEDTQRYPCGLGSREPRDLSLSSLPYSGEPCSPGFGLSLCKQGGRPLGSSGHRRCQAVHRCP